MIFFDKIKDVTHVNGPKQFPHRGSKLSNEIFVANGFGLYDIRSGNGAGLFFDPGACTGQISE